MTAKPIAILGCGPAGLLAAHACAIARKPFVILSDKPTKSPLGGAQFLHAPIPLLTETEPEAMIRYRVRGDRDTYRDKVYGHDESVPFVSFDPKLEDCEQPAWNLLRTYDQLWDLLSPHITDVLINPAWIESEAHKFSAVMSTVPLVHLCRARAGLLGDKRHSFTVQDIWVHPNHMDPIPNNWIIYDGTPDRTWYRSSHLFGTSYTEWSVLASAKPIVTPLFRDRKPIHTNCDCYHSEVIRLGRRGTWTKGVLTHDAFLKALEVASS